jgi:hypothetical protein
LVIDEIQRLNEASSGGAAKMLNFFGQMVNQFSVPVVLVGTFKALPLLSGEFAQARRSAGQGDLVWSNLPQDDVWDFFIEGVWHYQWTKSETPLTPTIRNALYQESQGIVDIAVKLYMLAQWAVIGQEDETISPELIGDVARAACNSLGQFLRRSRSEILPHSVGSRISCRPSVTSNNIYVEHANG